MRINLVSVEDGIIALGIRKMAAFLTSINADTFTYYYAPLSRRSIWDRIMAKEIEPGNESFVNGIARGVAQADIVAFSSMSDYAYFVKDIIKEIRQLNPNAYIIWGGIHSIIVPEDAIQHADAICTGEGEFAFQEFFNKFKEGKDFLSTRNFWFNHNGTIIRNGFRPLMTNEEMSGLPLLEYASGMEMILDRRGEFAPLTQDHYLLCNGLGYNTIWSLGCPFHCTYCGNTKFIDNDKNYRRLRRPNVDYIIREIEKAVSVHPYLGSILFHDDSFMALPIDTLREFAYEYKRKIDIPFSVFGVIPNYVVDEKFDILCQAGMNRIRMGIQSGSAKILEFYKRPSPPERVMQSAITINRYTPYMIPPTYDFILDNPIETKQDVEDTLRVVYKLPRPFHLNLFSLRLMPNTEMERQFEELKMRPADIATGYVNLAPTLANALLYLLTVIRPPRFIFEWWLKKAKPFNAEQKMYPKLNHVLRFLWVFRRMLDHLWHLDFYRAPGGLGYLLYKLGIIQFWKKFVVKQYQPKDRSILGKGFNHRHIYAGGT